MPQVIPFLAAGGLGAAGGAAAGGAAIGGVAGMLGITSVTTAAIVNAAVGTALVVGASYAVAKLTAPKMPRPADGNTERRDNLAVRFFPYGLCKVSGPVLFLEVNDHNLLKITAVSARELGAMDYLVVDGHGSGIPLSGGISGSDGSWSNWTASGTQYGNVRTHRGTDTQAADAMLMANYPGLWTSDHRLRGIAYVAALFETPEGELAGEKFQEAFPTGEPTLGVIGGVKLYDPRKDSTNGGSGSHRMNDPTSWEFSDNQRLACLDWLTWRDGYAKDWSRIDWSTWVPQINMADDAIALKAGGTEPRYRIATIVSLDEPKSRVLRRILDAGDQQLFMTAAGLIGSRGGIWQAPTVSLDATALIETQFTHGVPAMDRCNEFQLSAMLPSHDYAEVDLAPWSNESDPEFTAGIVRRQPLQLSQVPSNGQAQRLAKIRMAKMNPDWSGSIRTTFKALDALGASVINLSFDELDVPADSFDGPFLVNGKIGFLSDRTGMTLTVSSIDPACYDWDAATEENDPPPLPDDVVSTDGFMADDADQPMLDDQDVPILAEAA